MEATLSDGYAHALAAEARLKQLDRRLEWLIEALDVADARQIRSVGYERRQLAHRVARLRVRLQDMHDRFAALLEADRRLEQ